MQYIFKLNYKSPSFPQFDVEADAYKLEDGYFHFLQQVPGRQNGVKVASVQAAQVFDVQRTDNEAAAE